MKNLLIIYPHWPPSNLAGVHRPRLIANYIQQFGWKPIILTVDPRYYEEKPDPDLRRTVRKDIEVVYAKALRITRPRLIGDIGLRSFMFVYKQALKLITEKNIKFIWIPIPSFYSALLGPKIHRQTGVPYGIDYIDPWVRDISNRKDWRHKLSNWLAKYLEPGVVKKASLLTGVAQEYYIPAIERNFNGEANEKQHAAFPYGFDPNDHQLEIEGISYPWSGEKEVHPWIYAGAFLPNSRVLIQALFAAVSELRAQDEWEASHKFYFIGTGAYQGDSIMDYARSAGIEDIVYEDRNRYSYLHVLNFLSAAHTVMVIGSTEKHYTASKLFQALLSKRPVWAVFHEDSTAVQILGECGARQYLVEFGNDTTTEFLEERIKKSLKARMKSLTWEPNLKALDTYSARASARKLANAMDKVLEVK